MPTKKGPRFQKGNQAAKGCTTSGAPRTVSPEPPEMIKLGQEMVEWVKENNPLHLSEWYSIHKHYTNKQWDTFRDRAEFVQYYEEAIAYIRKNYIDGTVNSTIASRFLRLYFKDLKDEENETAEFHAKLKSANDQIVDPEFKKKFDDLMDMYSKAQVKKDQS